MNNIITETAVFLFRLVFTAFLLGMIFALLALLLLSGSCS